MKNIVLLLLYCCLCGVSHGQGYKIIAEIPTNDVIKPGGDLFTYQGINK